MARTSSRWSLLFGTVVASALSSPGLLHAQSVTTGAVEGTVTVGLAPLPDAHVIVRDAASGFVREIFTDQRGRFEVNFLPPASYEVLVEELGYRPEIVTGIPVRPGRGISLDVELEPAVPPVERIDSVAFDVGAHGVNRPATGLWISHSDLQDHAARRRALTELAILSPMVTEALEATGLPSALTDLRIDGMSFAPARHPIGSVEDLPGIAFPRSAFQAGEFLVNDLDAALGGTAGALVGAYSKRPGRELGVEGFGAFSGDAFWNAGSAQEPVETFNSGWGALAVDVPLLPDTAHLRVGLDGQYLSDPTAAFLDPDAAAAVEGARPELASLALGAPGVDETIIVAGHSVLDWLVGPRSAVRFRVNGARLLGPERPLGNSWVSRPSFLRPAVDGTDVSAAGSLHSRLSESVFLEVRGGFGYSSRQYEPSTLPGQLPGGDAVLPWTVFAGSGAAFGSAAGLPADVSRTEAEAEAAAHWHPGQHRLKGGFDAVLPRYQYAHAFERAGTFLFSGPAEAAAGDGVFVQTAGAPARTDFDAPRLGLFLQDAWDAAPGLELLLGARFEVESLPDDGLTENPRFRELTGISNREFDRTLDRLGTRVGFTWDVGARARTVLQAGAGVFYGHVDPALLHEAITLDGGVRVRRQAGDLTSWPLAPPGATPSGAPVRLSILGPDLEAPRTGRASVGITQMLEEHTALHVAGLYRETENLPRRADLNLAPIALADGEFGRPIFGELEQRGALVTAVPGSNRRFDEFDHVWARNVDGWSEYLGLGVAVERSAGPWVDLHASYTWSETRDNLVGAGRGPLAELHPFGEPADNDVWAEEATSDFDVPHRVVLSGTLHSTTATTAPGFRLSGVYRYRSGYPFTPGFRGGVDVNGDGSGWNDPAFVRDLPALQELAAQWSCLAEQVGGFAARNSCRGDGVHSLDIRVALGFALDERRKIEVFADAFNLTQSDDGVRDTALYLVDPAGDIGTGTGGEVTLPLQVNPDFGELLVPDLSGQIIRLGLRFTY